MVFNGADTQSIVIEDLPVGALVTVTEVYAGGNYKSADGAVKKTTIIRDELKTEEVELAEIKFTNTYNDTYKGGGSVTNTITDASQAEQNYAQEAGGDKE